MKLNAQLSMTLSLFIKNLIQVIGLQVHFQHEIKYVCYLYQKLLLFSSFDFILLITLNGVNQLRYEGKPASTGVNQLVRGLTSLGCQALYLKSGPCFLPWPEWGSKPHRTKVWMGWEEWVYESVLLSPPSIAGESLGINK